MIHDNLTVIIQIVFNIDHLPPADIWEQRPQQSHLSPFHWKENYR